LRKLPFYPVLWTPLSRLLAAIVYLFFVTNLPHRLCARSIRTLPFTCVQFIAFWEAQDVQDNNVKK